MNGRWSRWTWAAALASGLLVLGLPAAEASHLPGTKKHNVVFQLNDPSLEHAKWVVRRVILQNFQRGVGGRGNIEGLELVVFGPALKHFVVREMDPDLKAAVEELQTTGGTLGVCGNTMKAFKITLDQLPDGSKHLPQGGLVRITELQEQGYAYLRP